MFARFRDGDTIGLVQTAMTMNSRRRDEVFDSIEYLYTDAEYVEMMCFQRHIVEMSCASRVLARRQLSCAVRRCYVHTAIATTNDASVAHPPTNWRVYTAVLLERFPVVAAPLSHAQRQYKEVKQQIELENCFLNNFELQQKKEKA